MEFQHLLPAGITNLNPSYTGIPLETCLSQRVVLQKWSANWPQECKKTPITSASPHSISPTSSQGHCPTEDVLSSPVNVDGSYSTGNVPSNHATLVGFGVERSEKQVERDLKRLYKMLARSNKYQKYREKQPVFTPKELIAKETIDNAKGKDDREKEKVVWPEFLERAFWTALVRWPPMGRKKHMLDGVLRGRNELVQDFIAKNTGIKRDRKQVSSHIQVLKQLLRDQPGALIHMATSGNEKKRHCGNGCSSVYPVAYCDTQPQRDAPSSNYSVVAWPSHGEFPNRGSISTSFSITDFAMIVEEGGHHVHTSTQPCSNGRLADMIIADLATWSKQYPEFAFLTPQTQEWTMQQRSILMCDASLKMIGESRSNRQFSISFDLRSECDLSGYEDLQYTTRFYEDRDVAPGDSLKEQDARCEFVPSNGELRLTFDSGLWADRVSQYQTMAEREVNNSLMRLTATQDVYGFQRGLGKAKCLLTILWRFSQTQDGAEAGCVTWRAVTLSNTSSIEQRWGGEEPQMSASHSEPICSTSLSTAIPLYHPTPNSGYPFEFNAAHHSYSDHHLQPPRLSLDILASMRIPDFDPNVSAAPSTATDYSHRSLAPSTATDYSFTHEAYDFANGHMPMSGAGAGVFEPVINMAVYDSFASHHEFIEHNGFSGLGMMHDVSSAGLIHVGVPDASGSACYPTKAAWQHVDFLPQTYDQVGRGSTLLLDGELGVDTGLWEMQSLF